ncbi:MAG: hypothetical protein RJA70_3383 [Pseudomonadota bacterium]|jgi:hypothetical protein
MNIVSCASSRHAAIFLIVELCCAIRTAFSRSAFRPERRSILGPLAQVTQRKYFAFLRFLARWAHE